MPTLMTDEPLTSAPPADDAALLAAIAERGDEAALAALSRRHLDAAYRLAMRLAGNAADAEAAVQEGLVDAWSHARSYRGTGSVRSWLLSLVANAQRRQARAARRRRLHEASIYPSGAARRPDDEAAERAQAALRSLPERYRVAVAMRYLDGFDFAEIAATLRIREKSARTRVARGLDRLRERLGAGAVVLLADGARPLAAPAGLAERAASTASALPTAATAAPAAGAWTLAIVAGVLAVAGTAAIALGRWRPVDADAPPPAAGIAGELTVPAALQGRSAAVPPGHELIVANLSRDGRDWRVRMGVKFWRIAPEEVGTGFQVLRSQFVRIDEACEKAADPLFGGWHRPKLLVELRVDGQVPVAAVAALASEIRQGMFTRGAPPATPPFADGTDRCPPPDAQGNIPARPLPRPVPEGLVTVQAPGTSGNELSMDLPWFADAAPATDCVIELGPRGSDATRVTIAGAADVELRPHLSDASPADQLAQLERCGAAVGAALRGHERPLKDRADLPPIVVRADEGVPWGDVVAVLDGAVAYERSRSVSLPGNPPVSRRSLVIVVGRR